MPQEERFMKAGANRAGLTLEAYANLHNMAKCERCGQWGQRGVELFMVLPTQIVPGPTQPMIWRCRIHSDTSPRKEIA